MGLVSSNAVEKLIHKDNRTSPIFLGNKKYSYRSGLAVLCIISENTVIDRRAVREARCPSGDMSLNHQLPNSPRLQKHRKICTTVFMAMSLRCTKPTMGMMMGDNKDTTTMWVLERRATTIMLTRVTKATQMV